MAGKVRKCSKVQPQMKRKKKGERDKLGDKLDFFSRGKKRKMRQRVMEEMRKNVEGAQHKSFKTEQSLCSAFREYVDTFERDRCRPKPMMTKLWQSMQSRETKNLNLDKDLEDILSKMRQIGGSEEEKAARVWKRLEIDDP